MRQQVVNPTADKRSKAQKIIIGILVRQAENPTPKKWSFYLKGTGYETSDITYYHNKLNVQAVLKAAQLKAVAAREAAQSSASGIATSSGTDMAFSTTTLSSQGDSSPILFSHTLVWTASAKVEEDGRI